MNLRDNKQRITTICNLAKLTQKQLDYKLDSGQPGKDLSFYDLRHLSLASRNLKGVNLSSSILDGADISNTILAHANLTNASLVGADLRGVTLFKSNWRDTNTSLARMNTLTKLYVSISKALY